MEGDESVAAVGRREARPVVEDDVERRRVGVQGVHGLDHVGRVITPLVTAPSRSAGRHQQEDQQKEEGDEEPDLKRLSLPKLGWSHWVPRLWPGLRPAMPSKLYSVLHHMCNNDRKKNKT